MRLLAVSITLAALVAFGQAPPPPPPPDGPPPEPPVNTAPAPQPAPVAATDAPPPEVKDRVAPGWAGVGAIGGIVAAAGVIGLTIGADATAGGNGPTEALVLTSLLVTAAGVPFAYFGGRSARSATGAYGIPALHIIGWISYGAGLLMGVVAWALTGTDYSPGPAYLSITGGVQLLSLASMVIDDYFSREEAAFLGPLPPQQNAGFSVMPALTVLHRGTLPSAPAVALTGAF
ncbi:MAG: hypothetical protein QM723_27765 [Myxococcaceae bacterium]